MSPNTHLPTLDNFYSLNLITALLLLTSIWNHFNNTNQHISTMLKGAVKCRNIRVQQCLSVLITSIMYNNILKDLNAVISSSF